MDLGIKDTVAIISGASKGMGYAVAEKLSFEGCKVGICSRSRENIDKAADKIRSNTGNPVIPFAADVNVPESIDDFVNTVAKEFGALHILVSNAGGPPSSTFETTDESMWESAMSLTLKSAIRLSRAVIPYMKEAGWGRIIYIASISAKEPIDGLILSNVIRPGILGLSKTLSNELAQYNILVNSVCPGYIATQRLIELSESISQKRGITPEEVRDSFTANVALKRL
ncbi:SDR family NAD(P)-dependent oxidoreductase, partial [candidate division KSB1 bacterium]